MTRGNSGLRRPPAASATPQVNAIDPIRVLRQSLWLLFITGVVGLVLGVGVYLVWDRYFPKYDGKVIFELAAELTRSDEATARENRNEDTVQRLAQTEAQKAVSEDVLEKVLRLKDVQRTDWAQDFIDENGNFLKDIAFIDLEETVHSGHVANTQFFQIRWSAKSAADVPVILNAISETYFERRMATRAAMLNSVRSVFGAQKEILEDEISLAQTDIDDFIKTHDITTLDQGSTALSKDLEDTTLTLNGSKQELQLARTRKQQTESKLLGRLEPSQDDVLVAEQDPIIMNATQFILDLKREAETARNKFSSEHLHVQSVERSLASAIKTKNERVDEVVQRNLSSTLKMVNDQIESLAQLEQVLESEIEAMALRLEEFTSYYQELTQKQTTVDRLQLRLDGLEQTQLEIQAMKDRADAEKVVLIAAATKPREKSWPMWYIVIPGTAILTLSLVLGVVFLRELTDKRLRYATDVLGLPGARLLGMVPDLADDPTDAARVEMVVRDHPGSIIAESYRQCFSSLLRSLADSNVASILVVGGMPESGATSLAVNLAMTAMASGRRVALVDANFRRPRIAELMGFDATEPGFGEVLVGDATLREVVHETQDGLFVLTAGDAPARIVERLSTESVAAVVAELEKTTDLVLVDAPPLVVAGESLAMASSVDASLLIARAYSEQKGLVARLIHQLSDQSSEFLGVILNRPRTTAGGYFRENFKAMASYSARPDEVSEEAT
jgi:capsular exopolysaccharide synthesis family protein